MAAAPKILAVNPGSTTTKIAVFDGEEKVFSEDVVHDAETLKTFAGIPDQMDYRKEMILSKLSAEGYSLADFDAFSARGGGMDPCPGGIYSVTSLVVETARKNANHPAALGSVIVDEFAKSTGKPAFIVNPPDVDELQPVARITGLSEITRESRVHALSHKEVGRRAAAEIGKLYEEANLIVAHIGGGISVAAHRAGKVVETGDLLNADCPMAPTRAGNLPPGAVVDMCFSGKYTKKDMKDMLLKNGGFVSHFGTSDALEVINKAEAGDAKAELVFNAMIYQVGKTIGSCAAVLHGKVDAIVITGGIARSKAVVDGLKSMVGFLADFFVYPGELEMEALAAGARLVVTGQTDADEYTGIPVWGGIDDYKGGESGF